MIRSSIDLGTNTCLLLIADWDQDTRKIRRVLEDVSTIVRLGEGVDQARTLNPDAMERTLQCLKRYSRLVASHRGSTAETVCVATSQARDAANSAEFFRRVESETGFKFVVISGDEEARLTFLGTLLPEEDPDRFAVLDIGGGSTEIISAHGAVSIDIGSVRYTERFFKHRSVASPVSDEDFWNCQESIDQAMKPLIQWREKNKTCDELVAVAGTATTLAAWHLGLEKFDPARINSVILERGDLHRMVEELKWRSVEERKGLPGMEPERADVILAGALIFWRVLENLGFRYCRISTRGLRYGVLQTSK